MRVSAVFVEILETSKNKVKLRCVANGCKPIFAPKQASYMCFLRVHFFPLQTKHKNGADFDINSAFFILPFPSNYV